MGQPEPGAVSTNGTVPPLDDREAALASLRTEPENVHLLRGFGPLVVAVLLFILMVTLAPSVAPERVVEQPIDGPTTTAVSTTATTAEPAP